MIGPDGTFVAFDNNFSSAVRKLRDALCDSAAEPYYIETVGIVGYRFIAPAECVFHSKKSPVETTPTAIDGASHMDAGLADHRHGRWLHSRRLVLASILLIGIVAPVVSFSRHWLTRVRASSHVNAVSRSSLEAAAEYSAGRKLWARRGEDPLKAAIQHFRVAIQLEHAGEQDELVINRSAVAAALEKLKNDPEPDQSTISSSLAQKR